jgi:hypothetical protein
MLITPGQAICFVRSAPGVRAPVPPHASRHEARRYRMFQQSVARLRQGQTLRVCGQALQKMEVTGFLQNELPRLHRKASG